ncbi:MAG: hypothetical protein WD267_06440, partial [Balneolales bacterium]
IIPNYPEKLLGCCIAENRTVLSLNFAKLYSLPAPLITPYPGFIQVPYPGVLHKALVRHA